MVIKMTEMCKMIFKSEKYITVGRGFTFVDPVDNKKKIKIRFPGLFSKTCILTLPSVWQTEPELRLISAKGLTDERVQFFNIDLNYGENTKTINPWVKSQFQNMHSKIMELEQENTRLRKQLMSLKGEDLFNKRLLETFKMFGQTRNLVMSPTELGYGGTPWQSRFTRGLGGGGFESQGDF